MLRRVFLLIILFLFSALAYAGEIDSFLESRSVFAQIYFPKNSWQLSKEDQRTLQLAARELQAEHRAGRLIRVEGFASSEGPAAKNFNLSLQRANQVKDFLEKSGLTTELFFSGYGEKNLSTVKLSEQRRVDIAVYQENRTVKQLFQESGKVERFVIQ